MNDVCQNGAFAIYNFVLFRSFSIHLQQHQLASFQIHRVTTIAQAMLHREEWGTMPCYAPQRIAITRKAETMDIPMSRVREVYDRCTALVVLQLQVESVAFQTYCIELQTWRILCSYKNFQTLAMKLITCSPRRL
jgi:hypothetical protein